MKRTLLAITSAALALNLFSVHAAQAATDREQKLRTATEVLKEIQAIPEHSIPPALLRDAQGIAVIPGVIKAGFVVGGRRGEGVLVARNESGRWGDPVFVSLTGGSVGWQAGVESTDVVLVFKNRRGVEHIANGTFTLGADADVAAGPVGREASAGTNARLNTPVYSYSRSRGLFAGVALDGSAIRIDRDADTGLYGKSYAPKNILAGKVPHAPAAATQFVQVVEKAEHR